MVWKTNAANFGLNDIPSLCVNSEHRPNSTEYVPLSVVYLLTNTQFSAFKLFYEEFSLYYILNLII
jgi:hypothetical protein